MSSKQESAMVMVCFFSTLAKTDDKNSTSRERLARKCAKYSTKN